MSIWTYVMGVVEFSTNKPMILSLEQRNVQEIQLNMNIQENIGQNFLWGEGSLTYEIHNGFIIFKGDLRDFYGEKDMKELDEYFTNIFLELKQNKIYVGDYVIKSWNRTDGERVWKYNYE